MNSAQLLRAGRGLCSPQSPRPRSNAKYTTGPKISIRLRQTRRPRPPTLQLSASVTGNNETSSSSSNSPAPSSDDALALARQLQGIWIADYARSSGRSKLLSAMGLSGLQRVTAEKLIEGVSLSVVSSSSSGPSSPPSPSSSSSNSLVAKFLTVVPFFNVTEAVPLDGSSTELPRRDLKPGAATVSITVAVESGTSRLVVVSEWDESGGGGGTKVSLRETYKLVKPTELHVEASLLNKGSSAAAVAASSTTVYRLDKAWKPRYSFPAQKSSPPSFNPFSSFSSSPSSPSRRSLLALSSALAATSLLAVPPSDAALPPGLISATMAKTTPIPRNAPLPPAFPRGKLQLPFAVLLLRSSYDALDSSDLIPMDQFQVDFFKIRSNCWEPYLELREKAASKAGGGKNSDSRRRPQQGDLSDPAYFDVIAFSQASTIDSEFKKVEESAFVARAEAAGGSGSGSGSGAFEFVPSFDEYCEAGVEEGCPESGRRRVVRSSPVLLEEESGNGGGETDLAAFLWREQRSAAGDLIYSRLAAGSFRGLEFKNVPRPPRTLEEAKEAAEALAKVFVDNGFALKQTVNFSVDSSSDPAGASLEPSAAAARTAVVSLRLDGPADLWATGALLGASSSSPSSGFSFPGSSSFSPSQSSVPAPAFAGMALGGLLRASKALVVGKEPLSVRVVGGGTATEVTWRVSERTG